jgi:hypothetical protein
MSNKILLKRNANANAAPTAAQLDSGELAINTADGKLFAKNEAGSVVNLPVTSISGQTITPGLIKDATIDTTVSVADGFIYDCGVYASTAPAAPTGLSVTPSTSQAALSWTAPTINGGAAITDYSIQYSSNAGSSYTTFTHTASTATSATITGLTTGSYLFRIAAVNSVGTGSYVTSSSTSVTGSAGGGATLTSFNSIWTGVGFTGSGTSASPYTKAAQTTYNAAGMQFTVVSSGTLRVTCTSLYSDLGINFFKNGTLLGTPPTYADANSGNGGNYNVNVTLSVAANDVIRVATVNNDYITWDATLNIWWQ